MITIKLKIAECSDVDFILNKQDEYSYAFRKLYKHYQTLNDEIVSTIKSRYNLNLIEYRSLISDVATKINQIQTDKEKQEDLILEIISDIETLEKKRESNKLNKKENRRLFKLHKKLSLKNKRLPKDVTFGGYKTLRMISHLSNDKEKNKELIEKHKDIYQNQRRLPIYILGEANQKGNRFFDFDLCDLHVTYKPNSKTKVSLKLANHRNLRLTLNKLQLMIDNKEISVSVRLSTEYLYLSFDDEKLNGFAIDEQARRAEVSEIKKNHVCDETKNDLIKATYRKYYEEQRNRKLKDKLDYRYLAVDLNPDYIGVSILDKIANTTEFNIVKTFYFDLTEINKLKSVEFNNKRRHGVYHIWKKVFGVLKYYNCGHIILEDLSISNDDLGNKESNRKVKNIWYRTLTENLIDKYCNIYGVDKILAQPAYTSFIGNLLYNYIDPVNASIMIGSRGMFKYIKNTFYPEFNIGTIMNTVQSMNIDADVSFLKDVTNWVEAYRKVADSGLRYRASINDCKYNRQEVLNLNHTKIDWVIFS